MLSSPDRQNLPRRDPPVRGTGWFVRKEELRLLESVLRGINRTHVDFDVGDTSSAESNDKTRLWKAWQESAASTTTTHNVLERWARRNGI